MSCCFSSVRIPLRTTLCLYVMFAINLHMLFGIGVVFSHMQFLARAFATSVNVSGQRPSKGQRECVKIVQDQAWIIRQNVFLRGEDDLILFVKGVSNSKHCASQVGVNGQESCADPATKRPIHSGSLVSVLFTSIIEDDSGDVILASELDFRDVKMLGAAVVYDASTNTTTIDEDSIRPEALPHVEDAIGEFDSADAIVDFSRYCSGITAFTGEDD